VDKALLGHGVGLSGCGAEMAAEQGNSYKDILTYYYHGVALKRVY
jgi:SpoIID/LytB domain protein